VIPLKVGPSNAAGDNRRRVVQQDGLAIVLDLLDDVGGRDMARGLDLGDRAVAPLDLERLAVHLDFDGVVTVILPVFLFTAIMEGAFGEGMCTWLSSCPLDVLT